MFWQFDTGFISQIDTLLDKEVNNVQIFFKSQFYR
jgi:hypothetical protein